MKRLGARLVLRGLLLGASVSASAAATPVDSLGLGARSKGMAGAVGASGRDFSMNYYNPARLAFLERMQLAFGYTHTELDLSYNESPSDLMAVRAWSFGVVAPGRIAGVPVAFGMAVQLPRGRLSQGQSIREGDPYWVFYEGRLQLLYTSINLALRPLPWWSVSVGTASLAATDGGFDVRGTVVAPEFERSEYESDLEHQVDANLISLRYPQFAMAFEPSEALAFGISYREEAKVETAVSAGLDATIDGTILEVPIRYDVMVESVKMFIPRQLNLAAGWSPGAFSLELNVTWNDWSAYESPVSSTTTRVDADPPEGVEIDLPESPEPPRRDPPGFSDRWVPRLGVEYRLELHPRLTLPLRAGYVYEATPVPPQRYRTNFLDADRHLLSAGVGIGVSGLEPWLGGTQHLNVAVQLGVLEQREVEKTDPAADPRSISQDGSFWALSAELSLEF